MSRIQELFERKKVRVLNMYCTAGFPQLSSTLPVMETLQTCGADIIELGMPYSDPLADGPVIQESGAVALANGMNLKILFHQLEHFRNTIHLPVILMGYLNPVLQFGFEAFCARAAQVGVDALIIPDLPLFEFDTEYGSVIKRYGLNFIFLVTPETSETRIRELDVRSSGFLYAVSSSSITGSDKDFSAVETYLQRLQAMQLNNPVLVGFGIKDRLTFNAACKYAAGAIIGTAYIKAIASSNDIKGDTAAFIKSVIQL